MQNERSLFLLRSDVWLENNGDNMIALIPALTRDKTYPFISLSVAEMG
jgi:hypothetical protein